jgi:hypothetical protein
MSVPFEKAKQFDQRIRDVAEELGVLVLCEKLYLVDLETKSSTSMTIAPNVTLFPRSEESESE